MRMFHRPVLLFFLMAMAPCLSTAMGQNPERELVNDKENEYWVIRKPKLAAVLKIDENLAVAWLYRKESDANKYEFTSGPHILLNEDLNGGQAGKWTPEWIKFKTLGGGGRFLGVAMLKTFGRDAEGNLTMKKRVIARRLRGSALFEKDKEAFNCPEVEEEDILEEEILEDDPTEIPPDYPEIPE